MKSTRMCVWAGLGQRTHIQESSMLLDTGVHTVEVKRHLADHGWAGY